MWTRLVEWDEEANDLLEVLLDEMAWVTELIASLVVVLGLRDRDRYQNVLREVEKWKQERTAWL